MLNINDEILDTSQQLDNKPRYRFRDNNGNIIQDDVQIELKTPVIQQGTPINKATLEGIQTGMLNDSKQLIAEITLTTDINIIDIQNLNLEANGGVYDLIIIGGEKDPTSNYGVGLRINNSNSGYYTSANSNEQNRMAIGLKDDGGLSQITLAKLNSSYIYTKVIGLYCNGTSVYETNYDYMKNTTSNVTSIQIIPLDNVPLKSGTQVKIYKRR